MLELLYLSSQRDPSWWFGVIAALVSGSNILGDFFPVTFLFDVCVKSLEKIV